MKHLLLALITAILLLCSNGVSHAVDDLLQTPLIEAAANGNVPQARALLQAGAYIDEADHNGITPLMWASLSGKAGMVEFLIANGARMNYSNRGGSTALHFAAVAGSGLMSVKVLISAGANVNAQRTDGKTPFDMAVMHATMSGDESVARYIQAHGGVSGVGR